MNGHVLSPEGAVATGASAARSGTATRTIPRQSAPNMNSFFIFLSSSRVIGVLEHWSIGVLGKGKIFLIHHTIIPLFHYSITPALHSSFITPALQYSSHSLSPKGLKRDYNLKITAAIARSPRTEINRMTTRGMNLFHSCRFNETFLLRLGTLGSDPNEDQSSSVGLP